MRAGRRVQSPSPPDTRSAAAKRGVWGALGVSSRNAYVGAVVLTFKVQHDPVDAPAARIIAPAQVAARSQQRQRPMLPTQNLGLTSRKAGQRVA